MQHATVLFVPNNACLRPRNTGIITMSWPQKITNSSSELIQLVQLCQLECTAVCNPSGKKIFNCFRACDKVSAERGTQGDDLWSIIRPRGRQFGQSMVTLHIYAQLHHSDSSFAWQKISSSDRCWHKFLCSYFTHLSFDEWFIMTGASEWPITPLRMSSSSGCWWPYGARDTLTQALTLWNLIWTRRYLTQSNMGQYFIRQNVELGTAKYLIH